MSSMGKAMMGTGEAEGEGRAIKATEIALNNAANETEFLELISTQEIKDRLIANTQDLMDRGGFGSPTFFIGDDDMYFGNDRIQLIEKKL